MLNIGLRRCRRNVLEQVKAVQPISSGLNSPAKRKFSLTAPKSTANRPSRLAGRSEEPLEIPANEGYGYYAARVGEHLGDGRYNIVRKLGWGRDSNVWLARDLVEKRYVALKILSAHATKTHHISLELELKLLHRLKNTNPAHPGYKHILSILDHFSITGKEAGEDVSHLCLVSEVLGEGVGSIRRRSEGLMLPQGMVKTILRQVLQALDYVHRECRIVHTDIKPDNMLTIPQDLDSFVEHSLTTEPPSSRPVIDSLGRKIQQHTSQPLKYSPSSPSSSIQIKLIDFGHSCPSEPHSTHTVQPLELRAPEVILGLPWSTPVDIWSLGCCTFELLTGAWLFNPQAEKGWTTEDDALAKMIEYTGESFPDEMTGEDGRSTGRTKQYFERDIFLGRLRRITEFDSLPVEEILQKYIPIKGQELYECGSFLREMLHLRPADRSDASTLLRHKWLEDY
ncbi:kinase-like protein [Sistotremastrum niveocremeum HHB9708]|uniref:non-specific serine/threonine protein kinase n=1 Tax=Sistotremastrum niveocremeum HHB9708 TaxID=1314777 RepID=A0A164W8B5_9AGAM|nr:kinase-like protein [Sistotremastrum niveocremeum HHB9708]